MQSDLDLSEDNFRWTIQLVRDQPILCRKVIELRRAVRERQPFVIGPAVAAALRGSEIPF